MRFSLTLGRTSETHLFAEALKSGIQFKKVIGAAILSTFNAITAKVCLAMAC